MSSAVSVVLSPGITVGGLVPGRYRISILLRNDRKWDIVEITTKNKFIYNMRIEFVPKQFHDFITQKWIPEKNEVSLSENGKSDCEINYKHSTARYSPHFDPPFFLK